MEQQDVNGSAGPPGQKNTSVELAEKSVKSRAERCRQIVRTNLLVILTLVGVAVGFIVGICLSPYRPSDSLLMWLGMPGELYIRMLKGMIVPLVVASVISGTASMDPKSNGRISGVCLGYIMAANFIAAIFGTVLCVLIRPGKDIDRQIAASQVDREVMETEDIFADLLRNIIPDNFIAACFQQAQTKYRYTTVSVNRTINETSFRLDSVRQVESKYVGAANSTNILGLIVVSSVFGVATSVMKQEGKPFLAFFRSATDVIIRILRVLIWSTPVGVASLVAKVMAANSDVVGTFRTLGMYFMTVMVGMVLWGLVLIPILFYVIRRSNPFRFLASIIQPFMITFATSSTVIALPDSFNSLENKNGVDKRISRFVAPVAATIGRSGSAIYISTSCVFIMQMMDMEVHAGKIILIIILTTLSSLAIPSVTGASLITVLILLTALNISGEAAAMLFTFEWLLDRVRSVVNLITQLTGAVLTDRVCVGVLHSPLTEVPDDVLTEAEGADDAEQNSKL